jgi:hypothetical protein
MNTESNKQFNAITRKLSNADSQKLRILVRSMKRASYDRGFLICEIQGGKEND